MEDNNLTLRDSEPRPIIPRTIDEAYRLAKAFALAEMLPKSYNIDNLEKATAKAFTAMQLGAEVGMSPMQSIQSIAVVNGMPSIWGDAQKALCIKNPFCEYITETYEGNAFEDSYKAICRTKRKGQEEIIATFSVEDAKKANLWSKSGTWQTHPKRMLLYKARAFALRDAYPDILKGLTHSVEEMQDIKDVTPDKPKERKKRKEATETNDILNAETNSNIPQTNSDIINEFVNKKQVEIIEAINTVSTEEQLKQIIKENTNHIISMPDNISDEIYKIIEIKAEEFRKEPKLL